MSTRIRRSEELAALLRRHQEKIAATWAEAVHSLPDTHYSQRSVDELRSSAVRGVAAFVEMLSTGICQAIEVYLAEVSLMRLEMGFDISEVVEALLLFRRAALPVVRQSYPAGSPEFDEAEDRLETCLRYAVGRLAYLYAGAANRDLQTQHERTALILDVAAAANTSLNLDQVLQRVVEKSTETFGLGCTLYLWDPEQGVLVPQIGVGCLDDTGRDRLCELPPGPSALLGEILDHGKPIACYGKYKPGCREMMQTLGLESALIVPIIVDEQVLVAAIGGTEEQTRHFTEEDVELAAGMANAVELAIKNAQLFERTHQRLTEIESIQRMTTALLQKLTLEQVLDIVHREACQLTNAKGCALFSVVDKDWLETVHSGGVLQPPARRMPVEGTLNGRVLLTGEPLLVNDAEGLRQTSHPIPNLESLLIIPMILKGDIVGTLNVADKPGGFTQDDVRILSLFADGAAIAIESARLYQQAEQLAVVEERQRLARELHDSVTQALYSVTLYAEATQMAMSAGKLDVAVENLRELHQMAREAMVDMRMLIFELHPPVLEDEGLVAALRSRLTAVEARAGLLTEIRAEGERRLTLAMEEELFWIALEAFNNIVKHADAQRVEVNLQFDDESVCMEIRDDGQGFDAGEAGQTGGMGLHGMEERVERIRGKLTIASAPGEGTTVRVEAAV
jgi:signal transduction histidine kinase